MDKIWYRNPSKSEVIEVGKKRMTMQNRQKPNAKKMHWLKRQYYPHQLIKDDLTLI